VVTPDPPPAGPANPPPGGDKPPPVVSAVAKPPPEHPLVLALRCFMEKRPAEALAQLQHYDKANQELLLCLLPLAVRLAGRSLDEASPQELNALLETLHSIEVPLRPRTELVIDKMCFCERIDGFGKYRPLEEGHLFQAPLSGRPGELVQVYVEVSNLESRLRDGVYATQLASLAEIRPAAGGQPVWHHDFQDRDRVIQSRTLCHDFFNYYKFYVPHIPPGTYKLSLQVIDVPTGRKAEKWRYFRVSTVPGREP
jgi:hypothetical protein